jgi:hypothetical protein
MKTFNSICITLTGIALLGLGTTAVAGTETFTADNDYAKIVLPGIHLSAAGILGVKEVDDTFDLTADGFVPGVDTAISGTAYFDVTDYANLNSREKISIDLGSISEITSGTVEDYSFNFDSSGGSSDLTILADINADGLLNYTVTATKGDFFLDDAELQVEATVPGGAGGISGNAVPDGFSTAALLGLGLLGIFAARQLFPAPRSAYAKIRR